LIIDFQASGTVPPDGVYLALSMTTSVRRRDLRRSQGETVIQRIILTAIFGFLWWFAFNYVGPGLTYLMILGSVLAVCACCCAGREPPREFNYKNYIACIQRCWLATLTLIFGLILVGVLVVLFLGGSVAGIVWVHIVVAAVAAPLFVRLICCAYES
jgi:hypothetical protein